MVKKKAYVYLLLLVGLVTYWETGVAAASSKDQYYRSAACYNKLLSSPAQSKYRHNWLTCIEKYQTVFTDNPSGTWAAAGLYMSGKLYMELYQLSFKESDRQEAVDIFQRVVKQFPKSRYMQKAQAELNPVIRQKKKKDSSKPRFYAAKKKSPDRRTPPQETVKTGASMATIAALRYWSNPKYTRVVIDADRELAYTHRLSAKDPSSSKPQQLLIELNQSRLDKGIKKKIPINDDLLTDAHAAQNQPDAVQVMVDIKSFRTYKIFSLRNPFRIVLDVWGGGEKEAPVHRTPDPVVPKGGKVIKGALAKQLSLGVSRIVIDPGHGGRDFGASGYYKGTYEKDIVLKIALLLAQKIRQKLKAEVIMTRDRDRFLTLEERTAIANTKNADLFISIHTNASEDPRAYGIETYFLNLATDEDAILVAARENAISTKNISDLQGILNDLMQNAKINESSRLAVHIQDSMHRHLRKRYRQIHNKGVKQAPFYVLLGAQMPSVLVETSFISNSRECKRLRSPDYQDHLADSILAGIERYIKETNPTASLQRGPGTG